MRCGRGALPARHGAPRRATSRSGRPDRSAAFRTDSNSGTARSPRPGSVATLSVIVPKAVSTSTGRRSSSSDARDARARRAWSSRERISSTSASTRPGPATTTSHKPGRPFFMVVGATIASRRSVLEQPGTSAATNCGFSSSSAVSSTATRPRLSPTGSYDPRAAPSARWAAPLDPADRRRRRSARDENAGG